jgi:hypothetical protein
MSEIDRQSVGQSHVVDFEARRQAMIGIVGIWKDRSDSDSIEYVRSLRLGTRLQRLYERPDS